MLIESQEGLVVAQGDPRVASANLSFADGETKGDHKVNQDWERVENRTMHELRHSSNGDDRYCGQNDYRDVPGQMPGRDKKRHLFTNARISRVSVMKPDYSKPAGHRCDGA